MKLRPDFFLRYDNLIYKIYCRMDSFGMSKRHGTTLIKAQANSYNVIKRYFHIRMSGYMARFPEDSEQKIPHNFADSLSRQG